MALPVTSAGRVTRPRFMRQPQDLQTYNYTSSVKSMHLSYRIASTGGGTVRYGAVNFREIVGRQHNVRSAHILLNVLARFRARYR
jgi:hypothetical protein